MCLRSDSTIVLSKRSCWHICARRTRATICSLFESCAWKVHICVGEAGTWHRPAKGNWGEEEPRRVTVSTITSNAHVSTDLNVYLFEMLAMSMRRVRLARLECTCRSSCGLRRLITERENELVTTHRAYNAQRKFRNCDTVSPTRMTGLSSDWPSAGLSPWGKENMELKEEESFDRIVLCT